MADNNRPPYLLGKLCQSNGQYDFRALRRFMGILNLKAPTQSYDSICNALRTYCIHNNINTEADFTTHIDERITVNVAQLQAQLPRLAPAVVQQVLPSPPPPLAPAVAPFPQPTNLDILFNSDPTQLYQNTESFSNLNNYSTEVMSIGDVSANGFIRKLTYLSGGNRYPIILKNSIEQNSDSLVYEYLVGQCINKFANYYPCFAKTYMLGLYTTHANYQMMQSVIGTNILPNNLSTYITRLDASDLNQIIKQGCRNNKNICIFTQYIPIYRTLSDFLISVCANELPKLYGLASMLHITYSLLSSLSNYFTHYDLHGENIVVVMIPNNQYVRIRLHLEDGVTVVEYKTTYMPVIIDYGHSFVNCRNIDMLMHDSEEIIRTACNHDVRNPVQTERACRNSCGDQAGYNWNPPYNHRNNTFHPQARDRYFIDPTRHNITHDTHLLFKIKRILSRCNPSAIVNSDYIGRTLLQDFFRTKVFDSETEYGSSENLSVDINRVHNVHSAFTLINNIVSHPDFNTNNDIAHVGKTLYKTIDIWHGSGLTRRFEVS